MLYIMLYTCVQKLVILICYMLRHDIKLKKNYITMLYNKENIAKYHFEMLYNMIGC